MEGRQEPHAARRRRCDDHRLRRPGSERAWLAAEELAAEGISVAVIDARFCKPLDGEMLARVLPPGHAVLTVEDHSLQNGFGTAVLEYAVAHNLPDRLRSPAWACPTA